MNDEPADVLPDEPIDVLVDAEDADVREETRETSRTNLAAYFGEIARIPLLDREEEVALARRARAGDEAAKARLIRLPVHVELLLGRYAREQQRLSQALGRAPTTEEIAQALGTTVEQVDELEE